MLIKIGKVKLWLKALADANILLIRAKWYDALC